MTAETTPPAAARTRSQQQMAQALAHVREVLGTDAQPIYGGLCHTLPILVRTNGLCQTIAFVEDKTRGAGPRGEAYRMLRRHIAAALGIEPPERLLDRVAEAPLSAYLHQSRQILVTWVYYKRFAVSLLGVERGEQMEEAGS